MRNHFWRNERGAATVLAALALVVLLGFAALVVDLGDLYLQHTRLSNAADAAALAGAQRLLDNPDEAGEIAGEYARQNGLPSDVFTVTVNGNTVRVRATRQVDLFFARVFGINQHEVKAEAAAMAGALRAAAGVRPFGVVQQDFVYGRTYRLKEGAGEGYEGNYGALALGGRGASTYRDNIKYGYQGTIRVGDFLETEPGNMSGPTSQGVNYLLSQCTHVPACTFDHFVQDCPRVITIPVIDSLPGHGRSTVQVVGFAAFWLDGVGGNGHNNYVTGRFIRQLTQGEIEQGQRDFGLRGVKLIQ